MHSQCVDSFPTQADFYLQSQSQETLFFGFKHSLDLSWQQHFFCCFNDLSCKVHSFRNQIYFYLLGQTTCWTAE